MLYFWDGLVYGFENIEIVNFLNNFCFYILKLFLEYVRGLRILVMFKKSIGWSLLNDIGGVIFWNFVLLEVFDLFDNNIIVLFVYMFKNMNKL